MIVTRRFQRLGDVVAGTMVVVPERAVASKPIALAPPASPVELAALPKDVVLDVDERTAIELFLRREGTLGAGRRHELATMIAGTLGRRFDVRHPDPARLLALLYDRAMDAGRSNAGSAAFGAPASAPPHRSHPGN
jgi:hypothetical protein